MGLITAPRSSSADEFASRWWAGHRNDDTQLASDRVLNVVVDATQKGIDYRRGAKEYDGFSQLRAQNNLDPRNERPTGVDPGLAWFETLDVIAVEPTVVIPPPSDVPFIKRMSTLKRRADVSAESFRQEWQVTHAEHLRRMPGVAGYVQNLVTAWGPGVDSEWATLEAAYDDLPIDGMVELWFASHEDLHLAFSSPEGKATMHHAESFIDEISTYLVETYPQVDRLG